MGRGSIDLNADVGEWKGEGTEAERNDARLFEIVTTVHVACGFHAGDHHSMARTVDAATVAGVTVGAHPSYPDGPGFGRQPLDRSPARVAEDVWAQLETLDQVARAAGTRVRSVKAHGALYNRMAVEEECAAAVAGAVADFAADLVLVVPAASVAAAVAEQMGLPVATEGFCDRAYHRDGTLAGRHREGAVVTDPALASRRAVALATGNPLETLDGAVLRLDCETLCIHGDTAGAVAIARAVRAALEGAGLELTAFWDRR